MIRNQFSNERKLLKSRWFLPLKTQWMILEPKICKQKVLLQNIIQLIFKKEKVFDHLDNFFVIWNTYNMIIIWLSFNKMF